MQNDDKPAMASEAKDPLSDDDIIEFAETVLADLNGSALDQGDGDAPAEDDDDIIDLTEVAEKPEGSDDLLDLTEDIGADPSADEDILELEDFAETAEDEIDAAFELEEDIEELSIEDDAVVELDDEAALPADIFDDEASGPGVDEKTSDTEEDEDIIDLFSAAEDAVTLPTPVDRPTGSEIEAASGTANQNFEESGQRVETGGAEVLLDLEDQDPEVTPTAAHASAVIADPPAPENAVTDDAQEKLELTEADRRILEEELSLDIADETPVGISAEKDDASIEADVPLQGATDSGNRQPGRGDHFADDADIAETETDFAKTTRGGTPENFDFDFDETADDDRADESDSIAMPSGDDEELSVDSLLADDEGVVRSDAPHFSRETEATPETDTVETAEMTDTGFAKQTAAAASMIDARSSGAPDLEAAIAAAGSLSAQAAGLVTGYRADRDELDEPGIEPRPETLSGAPFEALVEQAVKKLLGKKIDAMLADAIDKAVTTEIERLKTLLLGNME
ncbi:MAG: hypothetical protein WAO07_06080 [Desulfobacterales bacterium]